MQQSSSNDLPNLDFLRAVAVLLVLADHLAGRFHYDRLGGLGLFGVLLFFVHTSLVLTYSMQRSHLAGNALVKDFYLRRFFRIYPLSTVAILAAVALRIHLGAYGVVYGFRPGAGELVSNFLLIQNLTGSDSVIAPLWSLPYEVQMYVVLPFLFMWRRRSTVTLLILWVVLGGLGHFTEAHPGLRWLSLLVYAPNFLPGVLAATLREKRTFPAYLWPPFIFCSSPSFSYAPHALSVHYSACCSEARFRDFSKSVFGRLPG